MKVLSARHLGRQHDPVTAQATQCAPQPVGLNPTVPACPGGLTGRQNLPARLAALACGYGLPGTACGVRHSGYGLRGTVPGCTKSFG
jgi:hypothetical protein